MPRGPKRLGMMDQQIKEGCRTLEAAREFLVKICAAYPIKFDEGEPYGAAHEASEASDRRGRQGSNG